MLALLRTRLVLPVVILAVLFGLMTSCVEGCVTPDDWGRDRHLSGAAPDGQR